jgi:hypothetical protein
MHSWHGERPHATFLNNTWRVSEDDLQWLLERKVGKPRAKSDGWAAVSFARTRAGLLRCIFENCGPVDPAALAIIRALPEYYARGVLLSAGHPSPTQPKFSTSARVYEASVWAKREVLAVALWPLYGGSYAVTLGNEVIVSRSRSPERDAARALLKRGFTGKFETIDCQTGQTRMRFSDIERTAQDTRRRHRGQSR